MNSVTSIHSKPVRFKSAIPVAFFSLYLMLGLLIFRNYGISWDEHWGRENGVINAIYMAHEFAPGLLENKNYCPDCPTLTTYPDVDHGPVFEIATVFLEWVFNLKEHRHIFHLRHFCSFLLFYISTIFFYLLLNKRFRNSWLSLAGVIMLIASPRIFAESFFNAKDIPFLSMTIICCYTLQLFLQRKNLSSAILHALACGITIDIRILGFIFPIMTLVLSVLDLGRKGEPALKRILPTGLLYFGLLAGFIIMFWPYLWVRPLARFYEILARSSSYPWPHGVLYLGEIIPAPTLPWHYLPVWIFISTPVLYTILCIIGLLFLLIGIIKNKFLLYKTKGEQLDLAMAGVLVVPIAAAIILKLVLYDGWRHMFFLYAGFIYMAVLGLFRLYNWFSVSFSGRTNLILKRSLIAVWSLFTLKIIVWMIWNHPHQNVYFSVYHGEKIRSQFEQDYWGLSYRQGLLYILENDNRPKIKVATAQAPGYLNRLLLTPEQNKRLEYVSHAEQADYFLTEYRWHPEDYPFQDKEIYSIKVNGSKIMTVFKFANSTN